MASTGKEVSVHFFYKRMTFEYQRNLPVHCQMSPYCDMISILTTFSRLTFIRKMLIIAQVRNKVKATPLAILVSIGSENC